MNKRRYIGSFGLGLMLCLYAIAITPIECQTEETLLFAVGAWMIGLSTGARIQQR